MVLAVTHVLLPIIFLELLRDNWKKAKRFFVKKHVFLVGVAGLFPDLDLIPYRLREMTGQPIVSEVGHRILLHNIWVPIGFISFFFLLYYFIPRFWGLKKRKKEMKSFGKVFFVLFIGFCFHLILDGVLTGDVLLFYPLSTYNWNWNLIGHFSSFIGLPAISVLIYMDTLLLLFWLWHEEVEKHILDYF